MPKDCSVANFLQHCEMGYIYNATRGGDSGLKSGGIKSGVASSTTILFFLFIIVKRYLWQLKHIDDK